jgi:hypothetical protein
MTALLRNPICVVALLFVVLCAYAQTEESSSPSDRSTFAAAAAGSLLNLIPVIDSYPAEELEDIGKALHRDLMATYEALKARQRGIFNEQISAIVEKHLKNGTALDEADAILHAAGFEPLSLSRVQSELPNTKTYFSNLVLFQGFSARIIVNVIITFRSIDRAVKVDFLNARMIAHYL